MSTFGAKKTPFMDVDDPWPAVYGLAALSKAWLPELPKIFTCRAPSKFPPLEFFHPLKTSSFSLWTKTPPTTEVTTTRFIIIFWCCSCLNIQRNVMNPKPGVLKSLQIAPSLFFGSLGFKYPKFSKLGSYSLKRFFFSPRKNRWKSWVFGYHIQNFSSFSPTFWGGQKDLSSFLFL